MKLAVMNADAIAKKFANVTTSPVDEADVYKRNQNKNVKIKINQ